MNTTEAIHVALVITIAYRLHETPLPISPNTLWLWERDPTKWQTEVCEEGLCSAVFSQSLLSLHTIYCDPRVNIYTKYCLAAAGLSCGCRWDKGGRSKLLDHKKLLLTTPILISTHLEVSQWGSTVILTDKVKSICCFWTFLDKHNHLCSKGVWISHAV